MAKGVARIFEQALLPIGAIALGVLVWSVGTSEVLRLVSVVGWWFAAIVAQEAVAHAANTTGLLACMPLDRATLGWWRVFGSRLAGEGVNAVMPTATIGGELLKISLISRRAPGERVTAGVTAAYASQALAQMLFTALGLPIALFELRVSPLIGALFGVFVLAGLLATWWLARALRTGVFGRAHGVLRKVGIGKEGSRAHEATERIDDAAKSAHGEHPHAFLASVLWFLLGWSWGIVEVALVFTALHGGNPAFEWRWSQCVAIESLSAFIDAVFFFVPGQMGTREGGLAGITAGLGLGAEVGVSLGLVRRGRVLVWAAFGLLCLGWFRREAPDRAAEPPTTDPPPTAPPPSTPPPPAPEGAA